MPEVIHVEALPADFVPDDSLTTAYAEPVVVAFYDGEEVHPAARAKTPATHQEGSRKRRRSCTATTVQGAVAAAAAPPTASSISPSSRLEHEVEVVPPRHLPSMGTFGSFTIYHANSFGMDPYNQACEAMLEEQRCAGFVERTQSVFDDLDRRKLLLTMEPPEAYEYARHVMETSASSTTQVNYLFAEQLRVMREPGTQRLIVTVDPDVGSLLDSHGYVCEPVTFIRTPAEVHQRLQQLDEAAAQAEVAQLSEQAQHALREEPVADDAGEAPPVTMPALLSSSFRTDVMGTGCLQAFQPTLFDAVDRGVVWKGESYAPLCEWSPDACKRAWGGAAERDRWEQAVMEMRQVYCILRRADSGQHVWGDEGPPDARASYTAVRAKAKAYAKACCRAGTPAAKDAYFAECREWVGRSVCHM